MRVLILFPSLLLFVSSAFAFSQAAVDFCFTTANPKACLSTFLAEEQAQQRIATDPRVIPNLYPNSLVLFGIGPALINGVNAGFHQMQLPYVSTPQFPIENPR